MPTHTVKKISSLTNPLVQQVVRLHEARERKKTKLCIVEGIRALTTVLRGLELEKIFCTEDQLQTTQDLIPPSPHIFCVTDAVMRKMSKATTPSGILGVCKIPAAPPFSKLSRGLVLAQVSDPGNMGTLIRTAAACAIKTVLIIGGADPWSPKVIQASAGTIGLVNIFQCDWQTLIQEKKELKLYALVVEGGVSIKEIRDANAQSKALLVVGNEARGIPDTWLIDCDGRITLSMPGKTESLNAAIAGSIALYLTFVEV